jgi:Zn ribbon nucleic-acid-binding protein
MNDLDPVCPYCMAETMQRRLNAWNGIVEQCLDCGYTREREPEAVLRTEHSEEEAA